LGEVTDQELTMSLISFSLLNEPISSKRKSDRRLPKSKSLLLILKPQKPTSSRLNLRSGSNHEF